MREVVGGNTLADLAALVGDVVYFNNPNFDRCGDDQTITAIDDHGYLSDQYRLADDVPYWHVVSYCKESQPTGRPMSQYLSKEDWLADQPVSTPGVQGYSSPTPDHVIFSMSDLILDLVSTSRAWSDLVAEHMTLGFGSWQGKEELSLCLPKAVFDEMHRRWTFLLDDQEAVLVLGTPEAQNWRPAKLVWLKPAWGEEAETHLGTWLEVTEEVARSQDSWSSYNGRYYAVLVDPPEDEETAKERLVEAKLKLLDSVMSRICAMPKDAMAKWGLYHDWSTWATMDKKP